MRDDMVSYLKIMVFSMVIMMAALSYPYYFRPDGIWTTDNDYNYLLQVMLPRLGVLISSFISGFGCCQIMMITKENVKSEIEGSDLIVFSTLSLLIGIGILLYASTNWSMWCIFVSGFIGGPFIGAGFLAVQRFIPLVKGRVVATIISISLLLISIPLISLGEPLPFDRYQGIFTINGGTPLTILLAALSGSVISDHIVSLKLIKNA
ncbi:hypothetical protein [Serratia fonticola]|uniref:hypothetical protein n=1 Tax=Serratia fonticola TaxID=47917 RepID=UPI003AB0B4A2